MFEKLVYQSYLDGDFSLFDVAGGEQLELCKQFAIKEENHDFRNNLLSLFPVGVRRGLSFPGVDKRNQDFILELNEEFNAHMLGYINDDVVYFDDVEEHLLADDRERREDYL